MKAIRGKAERRSKNLIGSHKFVRIGIGPKLKRIRYTLTAESPQHGSDIVVVEMLFANRSLDFWSSDARNPNRKEGPQLGRTIDLVHIRKRNQRRYPILLLEYFRVAHGPTIQSTAKNKYREPSQDQYELSIVGTVNRFSATP